MFLRQVRERERILSSAGWEIGGDGLRQSVWHVPCSSHPSPVPRPAPVPRQHALGCPPLGAVPACRVTTRVVRAPLKAELTGRLGHQGRRAPLRPQPTAEAPASSSPPHTQYSSVALPLVPMGTHGVTPSVRPSPPPMPPPLLPSPSDRFPARPGPACPRQPACRAATGIAVAGDVAGDAPWGEVWWGGGGGLTLGRTWAQHRYDTSTLRDTRADARAGAVRGARCGQVVTTPGVGFGPAGQGFIRISAFGHRENVIEACSRFRTAFKK
jgi:hypothetical protein